MYECISVIVRFLIFLFRIFCGKRKIEKERVMLDLEKLFIVLFFFNFYFLEGRLFLLKVIFYIKYNEYIY